jgi:uncharacterized protein YcaQ
VTPPSSPHRISQARLRAYRAAAFRLSRGRRVRTPRQALSFVNERGFAFFWTIDGIDLPSLWTAVAGDRRVPREHDDPGHVTWGWKDSALSQRRWFYAKLLRGKSTMVSLKTLPYFYALSERLGDLDDYDLAYDAGRLSREARAVADALRLNGAQHTVALRQLTHLASEASKPRFDKALHDLQRGLWVVPVGVAEAGAWRYAFIYELFDRWFPSIARQARDIPRDVARRHLTRLYLDSVGAADVRQVRSLFGWGQPEVEQALEAVVGAGNAFRLADGRWATARLWARRPRQRGA